MNNRKTDNTVNQVLFRVGMVLVPFLLTVILSLGAYFAARHMDKFDQQTANVVSIDKKLTGMIYQNEGLIKTQSELKKNLESVEKTVNRLENKQISILDNQEIFCVAMKRYWPEHQCRDIK